MPITIECDWCRKPIQRKPCELRMYKHHFCNQECKGAWQSEHVKGSQHPTWSQVIVHCDQCGAELRRPPCEIHAHEHHFCNRTCYHAWRRNQEHLIEKATANLKPMYGPENPGWVPKVKVTCKYCSKVRKVPPSLANRPFCNQECMGAWMSENLTGTDNRNWQGGKEVACSQCGKPVYRLPVYLEKCKFHFCSPECQATWQSIHLCGENNPNWRGGRIPYYGPNWVQQRRLVRERDDYTCQNCGKTEEELGKQLDVHHIIPFRTFGIARYEEANKLDNLISLCPHCHSHT